MSDNAEPLVSILTPVYNGEKYIQKCVESVLAQTYHNWEFIVANNCSTDKTLDIVSRYASENPKIKVYNNPVLVNALQNHNQVVKRISVDSKYCKLLHADDWFFPNCLEMMVRVAEGHPSVGIVGSYGVAGDHVVGDGVPYETEVVPGRELARLSLLGRILPFYSPSSLLFRSDLVRQLDPFYDEDSLHADHKVCYEMLKACDFGIVHQVLTYIRKHPDSITSSVASPVDMQLINRLDLFLEYGPEFLAQDEFEQRRRGIFAKYYRDLGRRFIDCKGREYWAFHRNGLKKLGYRFDTFRFGREVIRQFLRNPALVVRAIFNMIKA